MSPLHKLFIIFPIALVTFLPLCTHALTWSATNSGSGSWTNVTTSANGQVVAAIQGKVVYISTDAGTSWSSSTPSATTSSLSRIVASNDGSKLLVSGDNDYLYLSTNTGSSWSQIRPVGSTTKAWFGVGMSGDGTVMVANVSKSSGGEHVYVSTDSGATWIERQPTTTAWWLGANVSDDGSTIVVTDGGAGSNPGYVYTSTDGGVTWSRRLFDSLWWDAVLSADGSIVLTGDYDERIHVSQNGGTSFSTTTVSSSIIEEMAMSDDGSKIVVNDSLNNTLYLSTTTGSTLVRETDMDGTLWGTITSSANGLIVYVEPYGAGPIWKGEALPPSISSVATTSGTSTATVTWTSDLIGNSVVTYGTTSSYGATTSAGTGTTSHSVSLTGLDTCTEYHFKVLTTENDYLQTGSSSDDTFTTSGSCFARNASEIQQDISDGQISVAGGVATSTTQVTFNVDYSIVAGSASIAFPAGTNLTKTGGGSIDFLNVTVTDVTSSIQNTYVGDIAGAVSVGITSANLTFSQNATITIPVNSSYNGQTLNVYYQNEGASDWNLETSCTVSAGSCVFTVTHATTFSAGDEPVAQSSGGGGGGGRRSLSATDDVIETEATTIEGIVTEEVAVLSLAQRITMLQKIVALLKQVLALREQLRLLTQQSIVL